MSVIWVLLIIYTSLLLILRLFKVHYTQSTWPPLHLAFLHIRSTYVLVTRHIHPTLWHLWFDPPTSQAGRVFVYETGLIETRYNAIMCLQIPSDDKRSRKISGSCVVHGSTILSDSIGKGPVQPRKREIRWKMRSGKYRHLLVVLGYSAKSFLVSSCCATAVSSSSSWLYPSSRASSPQQ